MMGNVYEKMENPLNINYSYFPDSDRVLRGGSFEYKGGAVVLISRDYCSAWGESWHIGFRVASTARLSEAIAAIPLSVIH